MYDARTQVRRNISVTSSSGASFERTVLSLQNLYIHVDDAMQTHTQQQVQLGHVRLILPSAQKLQGLVLLTAATGEETYQDRERRFAKPLSEHGVGVLMLTMPFYGTRRPSGQVECYIRTVSEYMLQYVCVYICT